MGKIIKGKIVADALNEKLISEVEILKKKG